MGTNDSEYDYIVVGSGAGGGPVAANLAEAGMRVLLLEAGGDEESYNYDVPSFHAAASEDERQRWDYYVRHYADDSQQVRDEKYLATKDGVLYPRAGTLGGCTAHNALITVCPHNRDWDELARLTGDRSWRSKAMQRYFERLEQCDYVARPRIIARWQHWLGWLRRIPFLPDPWTNRSRHGFEGWLSTNVSSPFLALGDAQLIKILIAAAEKSLSDFLERPLTALEGLNTFFDPNDWRARAKNAQGIWFVPMATKRGRRNGTRERIQTVEQRHPQNLETRTQCLVTRVIFDAANTAVGVEYVDLPHAYGADPRFQRDVPLPPPKQATALNEVILSAGAFNTPQLLMLSGIGPAEELGRHGIEVRVDVPGVGKGLQDRYEVGVISEMKSDFALLKGKSFTAPKPGAETEPAFRDWLAGEGVYTSNGVVIGITKKSHRLRPEPDLFIFGLPSRFSGYYPGYSRELERSKNFFTWAILKAHTNNTAGYVTLRSADPRETPEVNFRYFGEGNDATGEDLEAVVAGIQFAREVMRNASRAVQREVTPGESVRTLEDIREYIRNQAWGHHASCTCRIGRPDDPSAVVDSRFRVKGTKNLRVVDASIFPSIPGFFIATAIFMAAEKASDVILRDAKLADRNIKRLARPADGRQARL